jgi:putative ABC transport system substrate-binding protein
MPLAFSGELESTRRGIASRWTFSKRNAVESGALGVPPVDLTRLQDFGVGLSLGTKEGNMDLQRIARWGVLAVAGFLVGPSYAQQPTKTPRIGILMNGTAANNAAMEVVRTGFARLGYIEEKNAIFEPRYAEGKLDRLPALAAELVGLNVDVIATFGGPASSAAHRATKSIPIVFAIVADPVAVGFVASLDRPGGNATGITNNDPQQARLQLELLRSLRPGLSRVAILSDQDIPGADASGLAPIERDNMSAAKSLGLEPKLLKVRGPTPDLDTTFKTMMDQGAEALLILEVPVTLSHRKRIGELAAANRLPSMFSAGSSDAGGILSFGTNVADTWPHVPIFVDRIVKGAKPSEMPVEVVTKRELVVNLKVARELGVIVPSELQGRADRLID